MKLLLIRIFNLIDMTFPLGNRKFMLDGFPIVTNWIFKRSRRLLLERQNRLERLNRLVPVNPQRKQIRDDQ